MPFPNRSLSVAEADDLATRIVAKSPSFLILSGPESAVLSIVQAVETRSPVPRPTYIVAHDGLDGFREFVGSSIDRRRRLFAVESRSNSNANARFVIRYNQVHSVPVTREFNSGNAYDAFYLLAYATFAIGPGAAPSGADLARSFARLLPPGEQVEVGPARVLDAIAALANGGRIDLQGTQTSLDYDLSTGEAPSDFVLLCLGVDEAGRATEENVESGVTMNASLGRAEGKIRCP